jgi:hypothetical protein
MLELLIAAGADLNLESEWENGPYTVLDNATEETARFLLSRGVKLTPNVAARLGWIDELRQLLASDPALVHARGGDGQQPLHEAATVAIAETKLKFGHYNAESHPVHKAALQFKQNVEKRSNGQLKIEIYPNNTLGSPPEILEQINAKANKKTNQCQENDGFTPLAQNFFHRIEIGLDLPAVAVSTFSLSVLPGQAFTPS